MDPRIEEKSRELARAIRTLPIKALVDWLMREEFLDAPSAIVVAWEVLRAPNATPKRQRPSEPAPRREDALAAVRGHVISGKPLSPINAIAVATSVSKSEVSQALKQLAIEGLVKQINPPNTPKYVKVWARTAAAKRALTPAGS